MTKNEIITDEARIGKDVIESLTLGMYEDCRFIYREYIQNSADQVDKAVKSSLLKKGAEEIHVQINHSERSIMVEDNATGISQERVMPILRNVAHSTKKRGIDKGFRGIGRLGGLGYCSKLIFETSYYGEDVKSTMTWDAELLKNIINDRENEVEAKDVLMQVTKLETEKEDKDAHYFKVILENVTLDDLLDVESVREYLSMVAPVDINSKFIFRNCINQYMKENELTVDTYNIYINGEQIFKPYANCIYEDNNGGKKKLDDIKDIDFFMEKDDAGNLIYWGWYSLSKLIGQMKPINIARGIRLRKENIQIGDEEICKKFFNATSDQRFSFYFFGEIHAVSKDLIPNSRRDYFGENKACTSFERSIKQQFERLKKLCYQAQKIRSSQNAIAQKEEMQKTIRSKEQNGYTSKEEKEKLTHEFEHIKQKAEKAEKELGKRMQEMKETQSPLMSIFNKPEDEKLPTTPQSPFSTTSFPSTSQPPYASQKTKYRTDAPIYSSYSKQERKLIGRIFASIASAIPDERKSEALISKIEEDLTR